MSTVVVLVTNHKLLAARKGKVVEDGGKSRSYRDLIAWQKSLDLVVTIYQLTESWPKSEVYGLTNQIRRAAVSVPSNIAEGQGRHSQREFAHFLRMALGSLAEVETQLMIAERLFYSDASAVNNALQTAEEVGRLTSGLRRQLEESINATNGNRIAEPSGEWLFDDE